MAVNRISRRILWNTIVVIVLATTSPALGVDSHDLRKGEFKANSRNERLEIAKDLLRKVNLLDSYLPKLPPSVKAAIEKERAWLEKRKDTEEDDDYVLVHVDNYRSRKTQGFNLEHLLEATRKSLECITVEKIELKSEMICWAETSLKLSQRRTLNDSTQFLINYGLLPKDIAEKAELLPEDLAEKLHLMVISSGYGDIYDMFGKGILQFILIPYLRGEVK